MASFLSFFLGEKKKTATVAKERLQIILAHERSGRSSHEPDYLPALQRDLIAVISKYIHIDPSDIKVNLERQDNLDVLEVKIERSISPVALLISATARTPSSKPKPSLRVEAPHAKSVVSTTNEGMTRRKRGLARHSASRTFAEWDSLEPDIQAPVEEEGPIITRRKTCQVSASLTL